MFEPLVHHSIAVMSKGQFKIIRSGMNGVEAVSADTSHAFGRHTHDQFGIGIIMRGTQKSMSGRGGVKAEAGDLITVNPASCMTAYP